MKRTTPWSASTSGGRSPGRKRRAEPNISLARRELIPKGEGRSNWVLWFAIALAQMLLLVLGLCLFLVTGFSLPIEPWLLYGGLALICVVFTGFYYGNWLTGARGAGAAAMVLATTVTVLFQQQAFLSGAIQIGTAMLEQMNTAYNGDYMIPLVTENAKDVTVFLLLIFIPLTAYLGAFTVYHTDTMLVGLMMLPVIALLFLLSASPSYLSMVCILLGILSVLASDRVGHRRGLWGKKDSWQWKQNQLRRQKISAVSAALTCLLSGALMIPSFMILMPSLSIPVSQTAPFAAEVKGRIAQAVLSYLPDAMRGHFSSPVSTFGGGVEDGSLTNTSGYLVSGVEDLSLSCTKKPQETVYLRGFIGSVYAQNRWQTPDPSLFDAAAANWYTEGNASVYLYNLPFLRMLYKENEAGIEGTGAELTVVRINANSSYTYTPYGSYLNEFYQVSGGDGAVNGQRVQDDIFPFYFRSDQMDTLKEEFFLQNESALDRLERSYAAFVKEHNTDVPEGFDALWEQCNASGVPDGDAERAIAYVQEFLTQNYSYSLDLPDVPEGEDAIRYFLYQSKVGCSPHFASAATIMFRMLGFPARYVVGYAASESLFTPQPGGTYHAVLQSDNAHAWVEIYISGTGWIPVETTPGQFGLVQDVPFHGSDTPPENTEASQPEDTLPATQPQDQIPPREPPKIPYVEILVLVLGAAGVVGLCLLLRCTVRDLGLDGRKPAAVRVRLIFAAYYRRLLRAGMPAGVESTFPEFSQWVRKLHPSMDEESFAHMMELVLESCFGRRQVHQEDVEWMRNLYRKSRGKIRKDPAKRRLKK